MLADPNLTLLTAAADGVAPAILLSIADAKRKTLAQYLFNAPESISRLVLEHKARPGLHFKALFLSGTSTAEAGGLGGMVLRMKQDGIGAVQLVGPAGTSSCLSGIKSFISWQHPHINIREPKQQRQQQQVADDTNSSASYAVHMSYADRSIQVIGFGVEPGSSSSSSSSDWQPPDWLSPAAVLSDPVADMQADVDTGPAAAAAAAGDGQQSHSSDSSSSSHATSGSSSSSSMKSAGVTSSESSEGQVIIETYAAGTSSTSSSSDDSSGSSGSASQSSSSKTESSSSSNASSDDSGSESDSSKQQQQPAGDNGKQLLFSALDHIFASGNAAAAGAQAGIDSAVGRAARALAQARQDNTAAAATAGGPPTGLLPATNHHHRQQQKSYIKRRQQRQQQQWQEQQQEQPDCKKRRVLSERPVSSCCCDEDMALQQQTTGAAAAAAAGTQACAQQQQQMLGYICHILPLSKQQPHAAAAAAEAAAVDVGTISNSSVGQLLAVLYCRSQQQLATLQQHPAVAALCSCGSRVLCVCHVTSADVSQSQEYQAWMSQLPGQQVVLQADQDLYSGISAIQQQQQQQPEDGSSSSSDSLMGFRASARVLSRLNLVSPAMFPPPHCLKGQQGLTDVDVAAIIQKAQPQQQQQQKISQQQAEGNGLEQPAVATAPKTEKAADGEPSPSRVNHGKLLQQLMWKGLTFQDPAAAASQYQYEWQQWADPNYQQQQQQQQQLEPLNVFQLQQDLLEQRPRLQQLLPKVRDRFAAAIQQRSAEDKQAGGSSGERAGQSNKSAAQALRERLAKRQQQETLAGKEQSQQLEVVPQQQPSLAGGDACSPAAATTASAPLSAAAAAVQADDGDSSDTSDESALKMLSQPWAADTSVIFLGTGSAEPSKYRGPSAILLKISTDGSSSSSSSSGSNSSTDNPTASAAARWALLDAGEGTLGAIRRHMGPATAAAVITNLGLIWISHKHADHMLGVPALLEAKSALIQQQQQQGTVLEPSNPQPIVAGNRGSGRGSSSSSSSSSMGLCNPVVLVGPRELLSWLQQLPGHADWQCAYHFVPLAAFHGTAQAVPAVDTMQAVGSMQAVAPMQAAGSMQTVQHGRPGAPPPRPPSMPHPSLPSPQQLHQQQQPWVQQQQQMYMMHQQQQLLMQQQQQQQQQFMNPYPMQQPMAGMFPVQFSMFNPIVTAAMQHNACYGMYQQQYPAAATLQWGQAQCINNPFNYPGHAAMNGTQQYHSVQHGHAMHPPYMQQKRLQQGPMLQRQQQRQQQQQQQQELDSIVQGVLCDLLGFTSWQSVAVTHCAGAHGLVLAHKHGWKLVYSGDTRPCPALVAAGADATLLIHEATFEADLVHHARAKGHSTLQEALKVAKEMNAYRTVLTHFSQRYPRLPAGYPATAKPWKARPLLAVDGAVVSFGLLPLLPAVMPAVAAALEELEEF